MQSGLLQVLLIVCTGVASVPVPYFHNLYLAPRDGQHQPGSTSDYSPPGYGSSHTAYAESDGATSSPLVQAPTTPQPHAPISTTNYFAPGPLHDSHPSVAPPSFAPQSIASASNSGAIAPPGGHNVPYVGRPRFPHGPYLYSPVGDGNFYLSPPTAPWRPHPGPQLSIHQVSSGGSVASQEGNSFSAGVDYKGTALQGGTMGTRVGDSIGHSAGIGGSAVIGGSTGIRSGAAIGSGTGIVGSSGIGGAAVIGSAGNRGDVGGAGAVAVGGVLEAGHGIAASHSQVIGDGHIARRATGLEATVGAGVGVVGAGIGTAMTGVGGVVGGVGDVAAGASGSVVGVVGGVLGAEIASGVGSALAL